MTDPVTASLLIGILCYCTYLLGKNERDKTIAATIDALIKQGYLRTRRDRDGELEIVKLDGSE